LEIAFKIKYTPGTKSTAVAMVTKNCPLMESINVLVRYQMAITMQFITIRMAVIMMWGNPKATNI